VLDALKTTGKDSPFTMAMGHGALHFLLLLVVVVDKESWCPKYRQVMIFIALLGNRLGQTGEI
jgi:hypothetical protein